jgi:hypothetical protein
LSVSKYLFSFHKSYILIECSFFQKIDPECAALYLADLVEEWPSKHSSMKSFTDFKLLLQQMIFKVNKYKKNQSSDYKKPSSPRAA